jgi:hypothetical protein
VCRCGAAFTSGLRTCHAVPKGMLPEHSAQEHIEGSNHRRDGGRHVAGGGSDKHYVSTLKGQTQWARHGQASRRGGRGQGGPSRQGHRDSSNGRQGQGGRQFDALPAVEWLRMVRAVCEQQAPNKKALTVAMRALGDVHLGELQHESRVEEALDSIKALLGCGGHDGGADDVR